MIGILLLVLHFICCIVVYIGIRSHILKIKVHMMPFVIFVPVTGLLCCLFLHFQLFLKQDARRINGVEKLKVPGRRSTRGFLLRTRRHTARWSPWRRLFLSTILGREGT